MVDTTFAAPPKPPAPAGRDELLFRLRVRQAELHATGAAFGAEELLRGEPTLAADEDAVVVLLLSEALLRRPAPLLELLPEFQSRFPALAERLALQFQFQLALEPSLRAEDATPLVGATAAPRGRVTQPRIPGFTIQSELGRGGMGIVYLARQESLGRLVALKTIHLAGLAEANALLRFRFEGEILARLKHPHIVQIYEVGAWEEQPYIVLEHVEGGSLKQRLDGTPWPPAAAARLVATLARAIHAAHLQGIVHRDLKPGNILLEANSQKPIATEDGDPALAPVANAYSLMAIGSLSPKITDFGLAKRLAAEERLEATISGAILGTPSYMAPEQARGDVSAVGPAADIYALGALLHELLSGRPPFAEKTPYETLLKATTAEAPTLPPPVPRDLATIVRRCLEREPGRRYASAAALADDLDNYLADRPIAARPAGRGERLWRWSRRNPLPATLAAALALLIPAALLGLALLYWQAERNAERARQRREVARQTVTEMFDQMADMLQQTQDTSAVRRTMAERAVHHHEAFVQDADGWTMENRMQLAASYRILGECLQSEGDTTGADGVFAKMWTLMEGLLAEKPGDEPILATAAWMRIMQAANALKAGQPQAGPMLEEAIRLYGQFPLGQREREGLAYGWQQLGHARLRAAAPRPSETPQGEGYEAALAAYRSAVALQRSIAAEAERQLRNRAILGTMLADEAAALDRGGRRSEAERALAEARRVLESKPPAEPEERIRLDGLLTIADREQGWAAQAGDRPRELACAANQERLARQLYHLFPQTPAYRRLLAAKLRGIGRLRAALESSAAAEGAYGEAVQVAARLAADLPQRDDLRLLHARVLRDATLNRAAFVPPEKMIFEWACCVATFGAHRDDAEAKDCRLRLGLALAMALKVR